MGIDTRPQTEIDQDEDGERNAMMLKARSRFKAKYSRDVNLRYDENDAITWRKVTLGWQYGIPFASIDTRGVEFKVVLMEPSNIVRGHGKTPQEAYRNAYRAYRLSRRDPADLLRQLAQRKPHNTPTRRKLALTIRSLRAQIVRLRDVEVEHHKVQASMWKAEALAMRETESELIVSRDEIAAEAGRLQKRVDNRKRVYLRMKRIAAAERAQKARDAKPPQDDITAALPDRASTRKAADKTKRPALERNKPETD